MAFTPRIMTPRLLSAQSGSFPSNSSSCHGTVVRDMGTGLRGEVEAGLAPLRQELRELCNSMCTRMEDLQLQVTRSESSLDRRIGALEHRAVSMFERQLTSPGVLPVHSQHYERSDTPHFAQKAAKLDWSGDAYNAHEVVSEQIATHRGITNSAVCRNNLQSHERLSESVMEDLEFEESEHASPEAVCRQSSAKIVASMSPQVERIGLSGHGNPPVVECLEDVNVAVDSETPFQSFDGQPVSRSPVADAVTQKVKPSPKGKPRGTGGSGGSRLGQNGKGVSRNRRRLPGAGTARPAIHRLGFQEGLSTSSSVGAGSEVGSVSRKRRDAQFRPKQCDM